MTTGNNQNLRFRTRTGQGPTSRRSDDYTISCILGNELGGGGERKKVHSFYGMNHQTQETEPQNKGSSVKCSHGEHKRYRGERADRVMSRPSRIYQKSHHTDWPMAVFNDIYISCLGTQENYTAINWLIYLWHAVHLYSYIFTEATEVKHLGKSASANLQSCKLYAHIPNH